MPVYEYVCRDCGGKFEAYVRSWSEAVSCPACRSADLEKLLSTFAMAGTDGGARASGGCGCGRGGCGCRH